MNRCALLVAVSMFSVVVAFGQPAPGQAPNGGALAPAAPSSASSSYSPPTEILGEGLDSWIRRLESKDPAAREMAVRMLPMFGEPAKRALPKIVSMISAPENDYSVRLAALDIATSVRMDDEKLRKEVVRRVVEHLIPHSQGGIRIAAAKACARIGFPAAGAIEHLIGPYYLRNELSYEARKAAAEALGMVAQPDPKDPTRGPDRRAIIALMGALSDPSLSVRIEAAQSLMYLGPPVAPEDLAKEKEILTKRIVAEPDIVLAMWLRVCLMRLDPVLVTNKNLDPIAANLRNKKHFVRMNAAEALGIMGPAAKTKAGDLREGLLYGKSKEPEEMEFLAKCLQAIGYLGREASFLKAEVQVLANHENETIRMIVKDTIDRLEGKNPEKK